MDTNAVLDLSGINLRNFSVFSAGFYACRNWIYQIKNTGNIIMKNLMDFVSVVSHSGQ
jgi:hypothetical protein